MRGLATNRIDIQAGGFAGVERLRNVRIENGWVYGQRGDVCESLDEYFSGGRPHVEFAELSWTTKDLIQFSQRYGAVIENSGQSNRKTRIVAFQEGLFWLEQWRFALLLKLAAAWNSPEKLRTVFLEALDAIRDKCWRKISKAVTDQGGPDQIGLLAQWQRLARDLHSALDAPHPKDRPNPSAGKLREIQERLQRAVDGIEQERLIREFQEAQEAESSTSGTLEHAKALQECSRKHLGAMKPDALTRAARRYLTLAVNEELRELSPLLDLNSEEGPGLYALCDNLKQRLYWMLALDFAGRRLPSVCVVCGALFFAPRENAVYCGKLKCKELGRKRRNWEKRKEAYNRARREKYKAKRRRERRTKETKR